MPRVIPLISGSKYLNVVSGPIAANQQIRDIRGLERLSPRVLAPLRLFQEVDLTRYMDSAREGKHIDYLEKMDLHLGELASQLRLNTNKTQHYAQYIRQQFPDTKVVIASPQEIKPLSNGALACFREGVSKETRDQPLNQFLESLPPGILRELFEQYAEATARNIPFSEHLPYVQKLYGGASYFSSFEEKLDYINGIKNIEEERRLLIKLGISPQDMEKGVMLIPKRLVNDSRHNSFLPFLTVHELGHCVQAKIGIKVGQSTEGVDPQELLARQNIHSRIFKKDFKAEEIPLEYIHAAKDQLLAEAEVAKALCSNPNAEKLIGRHGVIEQAHYGKRYIDLLAKLDN